MSDINFMIYIEINSLILPSKIKKIYKRKYIHTPIFQPGWQRSQPSICYDTRSSIAGTVALHLQLSRDKLDSLSP